MAQSGWTLCAMLLALSEVSRLASEIFLSRLRRAFFGNLLSIGFLMVTPEEYRERVHLDP